MKRLIAILSGFAVVLTVSMAFAASPSELQRMSTFISNFTETGLYNFDDVDDLPNSELIRFGIWHNYVNNYKTRIKPCQQNCGYGSLIVDGKHVAESVRKYFNRGIRHDSIRQGRDFLYYDGQYYHFEGADGESLQAVVTDARNRGGLVVMRGYTYYADHEDERGADFTATAKPYKYNGKNTWSIVSLNIEE